MSEKKKKNKNNKFKSILTSSPFSSHDVIYRSSIELTEHVQTGLLPQNPRTAHVLGPNVGHGDCPVGQLWRYKTRFGQYRSCHVEGYQTFCELERAGN